MSADADAGAGAAAAAAAEEERRAENAYKTPNCHIAADKLPFLLLLFLLLLTADFEATGGGGREPANINMFKTGRTTEQAAITT